MDKCSNILKFYAEMKERKEDQESWSHEVDEVVVIWSLEDGTTVKNGE